MKDHEIAQLVNDLRDAIVFELRCWSRDAEYNSGRIRTVISNRLVPVIKELRECPPVCERQKQICEKCLMKGDDK